MTLTEWRTIIAIGLLAGRHITPEATYRIKCARTHFMRENCMYSLSGGRWPARRKRATSDPTGAGASINSEPHSEEGWVFTEIGVYSVVGAMEDKLIAHKHYIEKHSQDLPEIRNWKWGQLETQS